MYEASFQVVYHGDQIDDFGRVYHCFEAHVVGYECSTILYNLSSSGFVVMASKHFQNLPKELQEELRVVGLQHIS